MYTPYNRNSKYITFNKYKRIYTTAIIFGDFTIPSQ